VKLLEKISIDEWAVYIYELDDGNFRVSYWKRELTDDIDEDFETESHARAQAYKFLLDEAGAEFE